MDPPIQLKGIASVKNIHQKKGTCFAHAISRCFVRTLQILAVLPDNISISGSEIQYEFLFYKLFFKIITNKYQCDGGEIEIVIEYLIKYLEQNIDDRESENNIYNILNDIGGNTSIIECQEEICSFESNDIKFDPILHTLLDEKSNDIKTKFESRLKIILPKLLIIQEKYTVQIDEENCPSQLIIDTLNKGLQPIISFDISDINTYGNLASDSIGNCIPNNGHGIILKRWLKSCVVIKNTWNVELIDIETNAFNEVKDDTEEKTCETARIYGDTTLSNINQLSCKNDTTQQYSELLFFVLTYDIDILKDLSEGHKTNIETIQSIHTKNTDYEVSETKFEQKSDYRIIINKKDISIEKLQITNERILKLLIKIKAINFLYYCYRAYNISKIKYLVSPDIHFLLLHLNDKLIMNPIQYLLDIKKSISTESIETIINEWFNETDEYKYTPLHYIVESLKNGTKLLDDFLNWIQTLEKSQSKLIFNILKQHLGRFYAFNNPPFKYDQDIETQLSTYFDKVKEIKKNLYYKLIPKRGISSLFSGGNTMRYKFNKSNKKINTKKTRKI